MQWGKTGKQDKSLIYNTMAVFISLLRGINVSGQKIIKMTVLKNMYEELGFTNVKTYLQSGNVIFETSNKENAHLEKKISAMINTKFGFDVTVIVLTKDELNDIIEKNVFTNNSSKDPAFLHITFLASGPKDLDFESIISKRAVGEEIAIKENAVYLYCPHGYGKTKLTNNFLETKLNVKATTRNWKTVTELTKY